ncbi:hypothetical protein EVAR_77486_1 [Eumeta japonica]|uniref:Uncharacterized protein n=1 Tax=Eumeta variegata TaxID=151549 RepID=A0A4C1T771_EUMVA|nr:hypothetical protein EVAR_77486_1 [Eumeta japonica]
MSGQAPCCRQRGRCAASDISASATSACGAVLFIRDLNKLRVVTKICRPVRGAAHGARVRQHTRAQDGLRWPPWVSGASSTACAGGVCGDCIRTRGRRDDSGELASGPAAPRRSVRWGPLPGVNYVLASQVFYTLLRVQVLGDDVVFDVPPGPRNQADALAPLAPETPISGLMMTVMTAAFKAYHWSSPPKHNFMIIKSSFEQIKRPAGQHERRLNAPQMNEVVIVTVDNEYNNRDIIIQRRSEDGYHSNIQQIDPATDVETNKKISAMQFYAYQIVSINEWLRERITLATKNDIVNGINNIIQEMIPGEDKIYMSIDTMTDEHDSVNFLLNF